MTAFHDFIRASASYFGLPVDQVMQGSTLDTSNGDMEAVLRIALTPANVVGIAQRMERMALEASVDEELARQRAAQVVQDDPDRVRRALRKEYNGLTDAQRSVFGSFHMFVQHRAQGFPDPWTLPKAEPEDKVEIPTVVWLSRHEATEQQKAMAIGRDDKGNYGVDPDDLTPEQRAARGMQ